MQISNEYNSNGRAKACLFSLTDPLMDEYFTDQKRESAAGEWVSENRPAMYLWAAEALQIVLHSRYMRHYLTPATVVAVA